MLDDRGAERLRSMHKHGVPGFGNYDRACAGHVRGEGAQDQQRGGLGLGAGDEQGWHS
jgi:hypothetical protein